MPRITVLGGSSVSTPLLVEALGRATARGELEPVDLRLWGRQASRLAGVAEHGRWRVAGTPGASVRVEACTDLEQALSGAHVVVGQIRPGGFLERARDEAIPLTLGVPGDEGLGPSGLRLWLRCRAPLDRLCEAVARWAPGALFMQLSSPLGLAVARARSRFGLNCYGVCELVGTTAAEVRAVAEPALGTALTARWAGLNHQTWIQSLVDEGGRERMGEVLAGGYFKIEYMNINVIREWAAIPVNYLKLYLDTPGELARQQARETPRGEALHGWAEALERGYEGEVDHGAVAALLGRRRVNWYEEGLVPAIVAAGSEEGAVLSLCGPAGAAMPGAPDDAVVELPHHLSRRGAVPLPVPPLPARPAALTARLMTWERALLDLPEQPTVEILSAALALHPLVPDETTAHHLARALVG